MNAPAPENEHSAPIAGRAEFQSAVRAALAEAANAGWTEIWLCDPDFANWPLGEPGVIESLTRWAGGQRRLNVLALHFDEVSRRHPRWVQWRRLWAHGVQCRVLADLRAEDVPVLMHVHGTLTLQLFDPLRYRGSVSSGAAEGLKAKEQLDAILQRSTEAFPATTLGL
jgi:hypothetical protein